MSTPDLARAEWRKSSRSGAGNDCVEVVVATTATAVRDSKNAAAGHFAVGRESWRDFLGAVKGGGLTG